MRRPWSYKALELQGLELQGPGATTSSWAGRSAAQGAELHATTTAEPIHVTSPAH